MLNLVRKGDEDYIEAIRYRRRLKIFENFLFHTEGCREPKNFCSCNVGEFARCLSDLFHTFPKQIKFA